MSDINALALNTPALSTLWAVKVLRPSALGFGSYVGVKVASLGSPKIEKRAKRKLRPPFFHSIDIIAISRERYGTSSCVLHVVTTVSPFGTQPTNMRINA